MQEAVAHAKQAVAADQSGDHQKAIDLYERAISLINDALGKVSGKQKQTLQKYVSHSCSFVVSTDMLVVYQLCRACYDSKRIFISSVC